MSSSPKISIILTSFNQGRFLEESIGSLLNQTYKNWECILVDDGSTDSTKKVATKFTSQFRQIRYVYQENQGVASARNLGISLADGEFIQFLDADDKLDFGKLEYQLNQLESNKSIDLIYGSSRYFFDNNPSILFPLHPNGAIPCDLTFRDKFQVEMILKANICSNCAPLMRRNVVEKVKFRKIIYEDWFFNLECAMNGFIFHFDPNPHSYSFIRMTDQSQMMRHTRQIFELQLFESNMLKLIQESEYQLDWRFFPKPQKGISAKVKSVIRNLAPPLLYSWASVLKGKTNF